VVACLFHLEGELIKTSLIAISVSGCALQRFMNKRYLQFMSSSEKNKMNELVEPITGTTT
jgi:hypothetical protein